MNHIEHLLVCLQEECGEVSKDISKALRFGLDDRNVLNPTGPTNRERIVEELNDLMAVIFMAVDSEILPHDWQDEPKQNVKILKVQKFMRYAEKQGALQSPPSPVCRYCGKVEGNHFGRDKYCSEYFVLTDFAIHRFTPISPEPISTKGGDEVCAESALVPNAPTINASSTESKPTASNAAPVAVPTDDGQRQGHAPMAYETFVLMKEAIEAQCKATATAQERIAELERAEATRRWSHICIHHTDMERATDVECPICLRKQRDAALAEAAELKQRLTNRENSLRSESDRNVELLTERDTLRTQLDLAQRQIAMKDAAILKAVRNCGCTLLEKESGHCADCFAVDIVDALSPSSARLYVRRGPLHELKSAAEAIRDDTKNSHEARERLNAALAAAEAELAGGAE